MILATDLVVLATNAPPATGGIERLVTGLCTHVAPERTLLVRPPVPPGRLPVDDAFATAELPMVRALPPRWRPTAHAIDVVPPSAATVCAEWWPAGRALARSGRGGHHTVLVHGTEIAASLGRPRARRALADVLRTADSVVANSAYTAELCHSLDVEPTVLPPPVDVRPVADPRLLDSFRLGDGPVVATVARLIPRKGHRRFLDRWARVTAVHPDVTWVIVGDGPERDRLVADAPRSVRVLGAVADEVVDAVLERAAVHLMPGFEADHAVEGFGIAAVEAGLVATPTAATAVGGVAEAIGGGGVVVPAGDHDALADEVIDLLDRPSRCAALGAIAQTQATASTWAVQAPRWRDAVGLASPRVGAA